MKSRTQKIRLGIFIVISTSLLAFLVIFFTARDLLEKTDIYYTEFHNVSVNGMEVGSSVKYLGIKVGTISDISINPKDVTSVIVELSLKHNTPIKADSKADIISIGITGLKSIEIRGGSNEAPFLKPKDHIAPGSSRSEDLSQMAEIIAAKTDRVVDNLTEFTSPDNLNKITNAAERISAMTTNADQLIKKLNTILDENRQDIRKTVASAQSFSTTLATTGQTLDTTITKINRAIDSDTIANILSNINVMSQKLKEANVQELVDNISSIAKYSQQLLLSLDQDLNKGSRGIVESQELLKSVLQNLNQAAQKINQNPSILIRGNNPKRSPDRQLKE